MHELAVTQSVVDMVVEGTIGRHVVSVRLEVGKLSGVVPDAMMFCYDLATAGTPLEGSTLEIHQTGGRASCGSCGTTFDTDDLILLCPCGSADVRIVAGRELLVTSVLLMEESCA
ncbi:MAG: hydrogenase maturation nickel metallochaperone HypA [Propionibacteriaceae bacterium]